MDAHVYTHTYVHTKHAYTYMNNTHTYTAKKNMRTYLPDIDAKPT